MTGKTTASPQLVLLAGLDLQPGRRNRAQLMKRLNGVLKEVNHHVAAVTPLAVTGDGRVEGVYAAPHLGFEASLQLRLGLLGLADLMIGLGWGSAGPGGRERSAGPSGASWRRAREALAVLLKESGRARRPAGWRTFFIGDNPTLDDAFVAWLVCRDELAGRMDRWDAQVTLGLLRGMSQVKIGRQLRIAQSAVSTRIKRNGAYAILVARERLEAIAKGEGWPGGAAVPVDPVGPVRRPGGGGGKPGSSPGTGGGKPGSAAGTGEGKPGGRPGGRGKPGKTGR